MSEKDGGAAFPGPYVDKSGNIEVLYKQQGMTLRDWFAGQALSTLLIEANRHNPPEQVAQWSYELADAMLKERTK